MLLKAEFEAQMSYLDPSIEAMLTAGEGNQSYCLGLSSTRAKRAGPKGLRAESARAVTGRRNSHRWEGGRLFEPSAGFFYGNSCNFGTKSRKIVSKVGN